MLPVLRPRHLDGVSPYRATSILPSRPHSVPPSIHPRRGGAVCGGDPGGASAEPSGKYENLDSV